MRAVGPVFFLPDGFLACVFLGNCYRGIYYLFTIYKYGVYDWHVPEIEKGQKEKRPVVTKWCFINILLADM